MEATSLGLHGAWADRVQLDRHELAEDETVQLRRWIAEIRIAMTDKKFRTQSGKNYGQAIRVTLEPR